MTQQTVSINKGQTITLYNPTFGGITITLNDVGEYVIVSNRPSVKGGFKQQYVGGQGARISGVKQEAFSGLNIKGDLIIGEVSQSIS